MTIWPQTVLDNAALCFGDPKIAPEFEKASTGQQFTALFFGGDIERRREFEREMFFGPRTAKASALVRIPVVGDVVTELNRAARRARGVKRHD